ncbi:MAG: exosortase/archaeosortase family protein, partial [Lentisphaeraceae bacterium]|nr:exosortase/archaeosortase family protein [Lentisphaeraceae bacterium]
MNKVLIKAAILASILFVILEQLDGFISVPLREISTWLSYTFLKMASFPVDKQGTLLSTPRMTFDVIPACSGSTTMRVMIFVGVLWAGMQEKMSMSKKLLLTFTVIPIAIVANSLRLCALVSMGYMLYKPVEGFLHDLTGMAAFVLAFGAFLGISMFFQSDEQIESKKSNSQKISLGILTIVTLLCYTPLFSWCLIGWNSSPLDKYGFIFPIFALSCIAYTWIKTTKTKTNKRWLILLTVATLITMTISVVAEVNILAAISFSFLILTGLNLCHGPKMLFISLPLVAMGFLGSPTVTFMINKLFLSIGLKVNTSYGIAIKVCLSLILLCAWFYLIKKKSKPTEAISYQFSSVYTNTLIGALCILLGIKSFYHNNLPTSEDPGEIKVSYILGDWIGKNIN